VCWARGQAIQIGCVELVLCVAGVADEVGGLSRLISNHHHQQQQQHQFAQANLRGA
jgi:uncharacterized membrane protein YcjF (UPF0283 family)